MRAYLVDGTYELFRAYYGGPPSELVNGREVAATRTFARSMLSLLRDPAVTHVGTAFDHVIESFRNGLFAGYKTGEGIEPALLSQFELVELVSRALGMATWPMVEFEADDALATMAARCAKDPGFEQILLCSPDKDLAQCISGTRVVGLDRLRKTVLDEDGVRAKFGVSPRSIPDYLALVGDDADGIPGIPGFGAKSAALLLAAYGSVDAIPRDPAAWSVKVRGAARLSSALEAAREEAALYRTLATLRTDVPLETTIDDLRFRGPDETALRELVRVTGDEELGERARRVADERGVR